MVRNGEICSTFNGQKYYYRFEGEPTQLMVLNGKYVEIAYDPHELGQVACYLNHRFIGLAHCIPLRKMGEDLFVEDERNRRAVQRDIKRAVVAMHQLIPVTGPEERLARRREVLPQRLIGGVELPWCCRNNLSRSGRSAGVAQEAMRAERDFRFADAVPAVGCVERPADEDGDAFKFFSDDGGTG